MALCFIVIMLLIFDVFALFMHEFDTRISRYDADGSGSVRCVVSIFNLISPYF
jgi:hypothetical protein